jgi:hypothetical protein
VSSEVLVDVGIPTVGRRPAFLREAVESVLAQTFGRWRLFVSANGVELHDLKRALGSDLEDPRIGLRPTDEIVSAAENHSRLFGFGDAPYVAVLHDDDRWLPTFLERRVSFLEDHRDCALVFSGHFDIDEQGKRTAESEHPFAEGEHPPAEVVPILVRSNVLGPPLVLLRRSACEAVGGTFDHRFRDLYDWEMWLRLAARFPLGYLHGHDAEYRVHPGQLSASPTWGEQRLLLLDSVATLDSDGVGTGLSRGEREQALADAALAAALDAATQGDRRRALRHLGKALRTRPRALLSLRPLAIAAAVGLGGPVRRAVTRARKNSIDRRRRLR